MPETETYQTPIEEQDNKKNTPKNWEENTEIKGEIDRYKEELDIHESILEKEVITYNLLENTELKKTMTEILSNEEFNKYPELKDKEKPEQRMEIIFRKINRVIWKFYERKFNIKEWESRPEYLNDIIIPSTEWFLMDLLKNAGNETNIWFLWKISELNLNNIWNLIMDVKSFSEKFTLPYKYAKSLINISDFISLPKNRWALQKLNNPYEFYEKVFNHVENGVNFWEQDFSTETKWQSDSEKININDIKWDRFWLTCMQSQNQTQEELNQSLEEWKKRIIDNIWNIKMVNNPNTIKKILWVLDKSDWFMQSTQKMWNDLLDKVDWFWNVADALESVIWIDIREEVKDLPLIWWMINFVLWILWFSWGIEWVERARKRRKVDDQLDETKKEYISKTYEEYVKNKNVDDNTWKTVIANYKLWLDDNCVNKFAIDINLVRTKIIEKIEENNSLINLSTLAAVTWNEFTETVKEGDKSYIKLKENEFTDDKKEEFVDKYIVTILQNYKNTKKLEKIEDADTMAFIMISWITVDKKTIMNWVEAEAILPSEFYENEVTQNNWNQSESWSQTVESSVIKDENKLVETISNYILEWESWRNYWAVNKNDVNWVSLWLLQWHKENAVDLLKRLKAADENWFNSCMTDPLFNNLDSAWKARNDQQANQFKKLMENEKCRQVMDNMVKEYVKKYMESFKKWWVTNEKAMIVWCRIANAGIWFAQNLLNEMKNWWKNINNYKEVIEKFNKTSYVAKYWNLFNKTDSSWTSLAQRIWNYSPTPWWADLDIA